MRWGEGPPGFRIARSGDSALNDKDHRTVPSSSPARAAFEMDPTKSARALNRNRISEFLPLGPGRPIRGPRDVRVGRGGTPNDERSRIRPVP